MKNKEPVKVAEIGPYPPPNSGWSYRIKLLKDAFISKGYDCKVLNLGKNRKVISTKYIDVQNGLDYIVKLIVLRIKGYHFHIHGNAQAVKGPVLTLIAHLVSLFFFDRASFTFHGGYTQLYFPKKNGSGMYPVIYLNFLLSKIIICNDKNIKKDISEYGKFINLKKIFPIQAFSVQYLTSDNDSIPEPVQNFIKTKTNSIISYIALRNGFFLDILVDCIKKLSDSTGMVITGFKQVEDEEVAELYPEFKKFEKQGKVFLVEDLNHSEFVSLLKKSDVYLRTPVSDGVASSVLEALAVGTVVVASDNGRRPEGVITYNADDSDDMKQKIEYALNNIEELKNKIIRPEIPDTVKEEVELLKSAFGYN